MPFLPVTAIPPQHDTFRFPSLFQDILERADDALRDVRSAKPKHYTTSDALQQAAMRVLQQRHPLPCINEAQHITYAVREARLAAHLDLVKWLAAEAKVPIVMVGTWELLRFSRLSGQLGRRMPHVEFTHYDWVNQSDRADFRRTLSFFIKRLPATLAVDHTAEIHFRMLFLGALGSVGLLKEWLEGALRRCFDGGRTVITLADLAETRMPGGKLKTIAKENEDGLRELQLLRDDRGLEALLGMKVEPKQKIRSPLALPPGTRALGRDPVGEGAAA